MHSHSVAVLKFSLVWGIYSWCNLLKATAVCRFWKKNASKTYSFPIRSFSAPQNRARSWAEGITVLGICKSAYIFECLILSDVATVDSRNPHLLVQADVDFYLTHKSPRGTVIILL
jgi:hypothetical protein